ncbi:unnamed protein product [Adineta ricciae]|uniref:Uncharacterized protein n=1 Tax=Adineta ricciae TaxID=249248 RepID=A0A815HTA4_ADIRI|nr:unnamed protein product [Adineta ricciae]
MAPHATDMEAAERLWKLSEQMVSKSTRSSSDHIGHRRRSQRVWNLPELAGIEKSCTETDSDFNGSSRRNDRPGKLRQIDMDVG